ncbi:unnamed protein product [Mytilus coruscus]|uniref:Mab-21-like HhH/H2TH-like domain-containing protein n=1 Tax=Mytilus coruscus TaxID=42192 RepID=A0A6J8DNI0_MYTCO|nr:unnamed protein product [Mytilus coruscus]
MEYSRMLQYLGEIEDETSATNSVPVLEVILNKMPKKFIDLHDVLRRIFGAIQESQTIDLTQFYCHSVDIYRFLYTIFGSIYRVKATRTLYKVLDDCTKISSVYTNISSGGQGEGLNIPNGDYDLMTILEQIQVKPDCYDIEEDRPILLFDNQHSYPGFAHLKIGQNRFSEELFTSWGENTFYGPLISNSRFKNYFVARYRDHDCKIHGPCISDSPGTVDHLFCFRALFWPDVAKSWVIRNRSSMWPPTDVILNSVFSHRLQTESCKKNKRMYLSTRQCMAHLLIGTNVDAIAGWLLLAAYFYEKGKPLYVLKIVDVILAKSKEDKMLIADGYHEDVMVTYLEQVASTNWNYKLSFLNFMKMHCVDMIYVIPGSTLNSEELLPKFDLNFYMIPPVIYAHVLRFVCYNVNDKISLRGKAICDIIKQCRENCFLGDWKGRAITYAILAKIYEAMHDDKSAYYWNSHFCRYWRKNDGSIYAIKFFPTFEL